MVESVRHSIRVRASIAHAFEVFTTQVDLWWPRGHRRFERSRLVLEATTGGRFVEFAPNGEEVRLGLVLSCSPPDHIRYTWHPGSIDKPTLVDVHFTQDGADTVVKVTHSEGTSELGDAWPERAKLFNRAWQNVLAAFAAHAKRISSN